MLEQDKAMKSTLSTARGSGSGRVRFQGATQLPSKGEDLNALVANTVKSVPTTNKCLKAKTSSDFGSEDEQEHFKFETLKIGGE